MNRTTLVTLAVVVVAAIVVYFLPGTAKERMGLALESVILLIGLVVVAKLITGEIDLSKLLEESGGGASMSRFQLLIFTFVIALNLIFLVEAKTDFPQIPANILGLLGISATTYGVSKGIQAGGGLQSKETPPPPPGGPAGAGGGQ